MQSSGFLSLRGATLLLYGAAIMLGVFFWRGMESFETRREAVAAEMARLHRWGQVASRYGRVADLVEEDRRPRSVDLGFVEQCARRAEFEIQSMTPQAPTEKDPASVAIEFREIPMRNVVVFLARAEQGPVRTADLRLERRDKRDLYWSGRLVLHAAAPPETDS